MRIVKFFSEPIEGSILRTLLAHVYADSFSNYFNQKRYWFKLIAAMLGLPQGQLIPEQTKNQSESLPAWKNNFRELFRNIFGWQSQRVWPLRIFIAFITLSFNVIAIPLRLALNILKLFTEFLPLFISCGAAQLTPYLLEKVLGQKNENTTELSIWQKAAKLGIYIGGILLILILSILSSVSVPAYYFGCCLTSPWATLASIDYYCDEYLSPYNESIKSIKYLRIGIKIFTLFIIGAAYCAVIPIFLHILPVNLLALMSSHLPNPLIMVVDKINPVLSFFGKIGNYIALHSIGKLPIIPSSIILTTNPALSGFGFLFGFNFAWLGRKISLSLSSQVNKLSNWGVIKQPEPDSNFNCVQTSSITLSSLSNSRVEKPKSSTSTSKDQSNTKKERLCCNFIEMLAHALHGNKKPAQQAPIKPIERNENLSL